MKQLLLLLVFLFPVSAVAQTRYYLGPWVWQDATIIDPDSGDVVPSSAWAAPQGTITAIDLRPLAAQAIAGGRPQGVGLFAVDGTLGPGYELIGQGDDPSAILIGNAARNGWGRETGYVPVGVTLAEILWDQLTNGSDPTGAAGPKPLMPGQGSRLELRFGTLSRSEQFVFGVHPHTAKVESVHQETYRAVVAEVTVGRAPDDLPGKVVDFWAEKYGLNKQEKTSWEGLVPPDLRSTARLVPHQTTITEDWNCADAANDLDCDLDWSASTASTNCDIVTSAAVCGTNPTAQRAESDLSSSDHYAQVVRTAGSTTSSHFDGPAVRFDSAADTHYVGKQHSSATNGTTRIAKVVTGTLTDLGTGTSNAPSATIKIEASGSTIKIYHDGVEKESITDTSITSGTRTGIRHGGSTSSNSMDNFEASDLATPATYNPTAGQTLVIQ